MAQRIVYRFSRERLAAGLHRARVEQKEIGVAEVHLTQLPFMEPRLMFDLVRKCTIEAEEWDAQIEAYYREPIMRYIRSDVAPQRKSQDIAVIKAKMAYFEALLRGAIQSVHKDAFARELLYDICLPEFERKRDFDEFESELLTAVAVEPVKRFVAFNVMDDRGWYVLHDWFSTERQTVLTDVVCRLANRVLVDASILYPETTFT